MINLHRSLVTGASGFIGHHMVRYLKQIGHDVTAVSRTYPKYSNSQADRYFVGDLQSPDFVETILNQPVDIVFHFAADMGGAGYTFSQKNDFTIMHNSLRITLNIMDALARHPNRNIKLFYPSSACVYPSLDEISNNIVKCSEHLAYPANPGSEYGWEKIFAERLISAYSRNYDIEIRIARLHTIIGPECSYQGGKEKAPAAIARKVIQADDGGEVEIWGSGKQTRSFLHIDDCLEAIYKLTMSDITKPMNIGSEELISINDLALKFIALSGKSLSLKHVSGPQGPSARNSDNTLIENLLDWTPKISLAKSISDLYRWVETQIY
jgi:nucleoside-diphosphate-sugar epimerase